MNTCGLPCSLHLKMADIKETSDVTPTTKAKKFNWDEDDIEKLIDLYEARPCLWDIADPTYSKRDIKEKALSEIKDELGIELNLIKSKWNSLRAQHGRELAKESKTKSGQSADEVYESSWSYMGKMRFVEQVKKTAKSTSTLKISTQELDDDKEEESEQEDETPNKKSVKETTHTSTKRKRAYQTEQKQKLIEKCIDVLERPKNPVKEPETKACDPFASYVSEQLKTLDKRRRLLAEKKINDILFELQFEQLEAQSGGFRFANQQHFAYAQPVQQRYDNANQVPQQQDQQGTYTSMLHDY